MSADRASPALDALFLPFAQGELPWPSPEVTGSPGLVLFLRARAGEALHAWASRGLRAEQSFRPEADALRRMGVTVSEHIDGDATVADPAASPTRYPCVLLLPPRQREEARALLARAVRHCASGGLVVAAQANDEGAKTGEADLARLAGLDGTLSKHRCRVYWTRVDAEPDASTRINTALLSEWAVLDAPRHIEDARFPGGGFLSRPGVFAWDRVDPASSLLAAHLPDTLSGRVADLGAGVGVLSAALLQRCAGLQALDLYEAEARALALARQNLAALTASAAATPAPALGFHWHDVASGLPHADYDAVVMNPPFHALGRADRNDIGHAFIAAAAGALRRGGRLWLVANRHLPYEALIQSRFAGVRTVADAAGFKVLEATR